MVGRIPVIEVHPVVHGGERPAKATVGEPLPIRATVFREGHDQLGTEAVLIGPDGTRRPPVRMRELVPGTDRYEAWVTPDAEGAWAFEVQAFSDPLHTWTHDAGLKIPAGVDVDLMFLEARLLLERIADAHSLAGPHRTAHAAALAAATDASRPPEARLAVLTGPETQELFETHPLRDLLTVAGPYPLFADRARALFGSWYEFFPRSEGAKIDRRTKKLVSGTFRTAAKSLDRVAAMGFDVLYLPPIHPIGEVNRKGRNNTLAPGPDDPGSPWAIGSRHGGHDAIHPDLGTFADFDAFVRRAKRLGIEVALDLALQAAPDHPWVSEHPSFFRHRADGSIAYAENPPKKYQDIYPIFFDDDLEGVLAEVERVVRLWMSHGVRIFRVDNPHTKPVAFWERLLGSIRETDPDVIFLSEAFTRPAMMRTLGAIGFHQSYTYFTWRVEKGEIEDYLREVTSETDHLMRPSFWVNTPDILHASLQYGGPAMFAIRATLAAMATPTWGMYAGYELFEHVALRPGSEEYLDSEKYQIRVRDWTGAEESGKTLAPYIARLNELRRAHPALQLLRNLVVHRTDDDHVLCFSKTHGDDTVIVVINLDPHGARETTVHLDLEAAGLPERFLVHDELTGAEWVWGEHDYVRLEPTGDVAHILSVRAVP
ncbi:alpha-1,4-glucan--maltose-1-phosphate maltosyltransferase [Microbacterium sediminis]|uniref:Alpha-1,4-glucan:maltose-1-phosphate maltosyltransferase n=1 Tax=Microbacterium sediminis TaxID=904291 RepID=A0A1B9NAI9_9MICO|nr:alpha-1,4-glucan--maltose-1-phosphate maltosyltransferase [Microbacterium sediminis]OCG73631.1 alpha-1,4-glucan--maltose-1-phosphate maltosyltransferase [Microbacterium sediminis]QBR73198.1 alpha-1,4-glucan--maltose-1-phosphate maltosyltransferase family protein [Microbacterium sediminis]